jgi:PTH1 family peptidyl-tRNA hydrolase
MNLSGRAVKYWLKKLDIPTQQLLVLVDDLSLPAGKIRIRSKGGAGGHNGLISIIEELQSNDFPRLRFGIGSDFSKGQQVDYVLGEWEEEEKKLITEKAAIVSDAIHCFVFEGIGRAMTRFNKN